MPYRYLDDIATADIAFDAWGDTQADMFQAAADAAMNVMLDDLTTIEPDRQKTINLSNNNIEMLLYDFLNEFIFFKDAEQLLLRTGKINITRQNEKYTLTADLFGQRINRQKHDLTVDIKAVTMHRFKIEQTNNQWHATVVLDI